MAKTGGERVVPMCGACGHRHYPVFGGGCPAPVQRVWRHPAPDGFRMSKGWGENTEGAKVVYLHPLRRGGSLTTPPEAA